MTYRRPLPSSDPIPFAFERFGRAYHFKIEHPEDLQKVLLLDEAHWVATSAPVQTINADPVFLQLMDSNSDGRIRAEEVQDAISWCFDHLADPAEIRAGNLQLKLSALKPNGPDSGRITQAARIILQRIQRSDAQTISLDEVRAIKKTEEQGGLDKPGMVLPNAASAPELSEFLQDILSTVGGDPHPSGAKGITGAQLDRFCAEARTYLDWIEQADLPTPPQLNPIMPLGAQTHAAFELFSQLRQKIDQYFALSDLLRLHPWMADQIRPGPALVEELDLSSAKDLERFIAESPLAWPTAQPVLDLSAVVNPRYADLLRQFQTDVLSRIFQQPISLLHPAQWAAVKDLFQEHQRWFAAKPSVSVAALPPEKVRRYLSELQYRAGAEQLLAESHKTAFDLDSVRLVEKAILFQANLISFVNSFVSFPDLYDPTRRALFEMGTLIMDGRHFSLSVKVLNREQHAKFSDASNMFMLYVEISDKEGEKLYEVAVPVTSGDRGNLQVNKWGIFHDLQGRERNAQVVQIVQNPISLSEAIVAPFHKLGAAIAARFGERANKAEAQLMAVGTSAVDPTATPAPKPASAPAPAPSASPSPAAPLDARAAGSALAGGGIAIAALGSSAAFITKTLGEMSWTARIWGVVGASMAVLLPVTIVAIIKLSKRDLSALLEGSGWAINARMRLTAKQARAFTHKPSFPMWSKGIAASKAWLWWLLALLVLVAATVGVIKLTQLYSLFSTSPAPASSNSHSVPSLPVTPVSRPTNSPSR